MAGQWELVGGVFWKAPPVPVVDEELSFSPLIILFLFTATASLALWLRIAMRRKQQGPVWNLRKHITEIGGAITAIYLPGITALIWGRIGTLGTMPLNEVDDFLAGAFGPVAFLWLVLGFLQQGDELRQGTEALVLQAQELRNSVEQQSIMAAAAAKQIKAQDLNASVGTIEIKFLHEANIQRQLNVKVACPLAVPGCMALPVRTYRARSGI